MGYFSNNNTLDWAQDKINERYSKSEDMEPKEQIIQSCIDTANKLFDLAAKKRTEEINKLSPRSKRRKQLMKDQRRSEKDRALFNFIVSWGANNQIESLSTEQG